MTTSHQYLYSPPTQHKPSLYKTYDKAIKHQHVLSSHYPIVLIPVCEHIITLLLSLKLIPVPVPSENLVGGDICVHSITLSVPVVVKTYYTTMRERQGWIVLILYFRGLTIRHAMCALYMICTEIDNHSPQNAQPTYLRGSVPIHSLSRSMLVSTRKHNSIRLATFIDNGAFALYREKISCRLHQTKCENAILPFL